MANPHSLQSVVEKISLVAQKAAANAGITFGTVLSRNPDGSLNVDDGKGGCARVAPAANVRVGDKIALGTEPAIGTQTSLDPSTFRVDPPQSDCPTDPRSIPTLPLTQAVVAGANIISSSGLVTWSERDADLGTGSPGVIGNWFGYRKSAAVTSGSNLLLALYRQEHVGSAPIQVLYTMDRSFIKFDLTGIDTVGATTGRLTFTIPYSGSSSTGIPRSPSATTIYALPSTAVLPITKADMGKFDRTTPLGFFPLLQDRPAFGGSGTYTTSIDLDLTSYEGVLPDVLVLCLMTGFDFDGSTPPQIGSLVDNIDVVQAQWGFSTVTLQLDKPLL